MNLHLVILSFGLCMSAALTHSVSSEESLGGPYIQSALKEAKKIVDEAYKYSRDESVARVRRAVVNPSDVLRLYKQPRRDTRQAVRAADYMEHTLRLISEKVHHAHKRSLRTLNATELLTEEQLKVIEEVSGCSARTRRPNCFTVPNLNKYRTADSICNNLRDPFFGASNTPFARLLLPQYDDGVKEPKGGRDRNRRINNFLLPLVREVSNRIMKTLDKAVVDDPEFSHLVTMFGQWNDHDLTFTPFSPSIRSFSNGLNCNEDCENTDPCFPIPIPVGDPRIPSGPNTCMPNFRSAAVCGTGTSAFLFGGVSKMREQINSISAFMDLGQVYGSEKGLARELRDFTNDGGLLRVNTQFRDNRRELLPFDSHQTSICTTRATITNVPNATEVPCFLAGDERVNENIALTAIHTLFLREHNRLARGLKRINPHWDSETLYQEARKIQGAYTQVIVWRDYLSHILGPDILNRQLGRYPGYNENVNPNIANMFATAAYRFGHLALQPLVFRSDSNFRENRQFPSVPLFKAFFTPWRIVFEGGLDPILRGMISRPAKMGIPAVMVDAVRDRLFQFVEHLALDLASLNMQRGRDHGLPGYNTWRRLCGLSQPRNEAQLGRVLGNRDLARRLLELYGTPDNIDVWLGGVAEPFVAGGRVGPLFACIIANQFQRLRQGDRLWYENPGVFTPAQRRLLKKITFNRIICDNTGITVAPRNPFEVVSNTNPLTNCNQFPSLDLTLWKAPCEGASCNTT